MQVVANRYSTVRARLLLLRGHGPVTGLWRGFRRRLAETSTAVPRLLVPVDATPFNLHHTSLGAQVHCTEYAHPVPAQKQLNTPSNTATPPLELAQDCPHWREPCKYERQGRQVHVDTAN